MHDFGALTEQMLRRSPALAAFSSLACAHQEKCDGSGYHKRLKADAARRIFPVARCQEHRLGRAVVKSRQSRATLEEQRLQDRAVATALVRAVAADGEVGLA